jgi:hypothetical protein
MRKPMAGKAEGKKTSVIASECMSMWAMRSAATVVLAFLCAMPPAAAQTEPPEPDPRAEEFNERGKSLFSDHKDYAGAAEMFRRAIAVTPDARYYYNLCASLERLEQWRGALDACDEVFRHNPRGELATKTGVKAADIREKWRAQRERERASTPPPPSGTPPGPGPGPAPDPEPDPAPAASLAVAVEQPGYKWSLGADLGLVVNGSVGQREYARSGFKLRVNGAGLLSEQLRIGLEVYLHLAAFGESREDLLNARRALSIVDLGAGFFWHKHLTRSLHITPLVGLSLSALSVDTRDGLQSYGTLGVRLEPALEWRFPGGRHVLRVVPLGLNHYLGTDRQIAGEDQALSLYDLGLDRGGTTWSFTVGYTYRFDRTPFPVWNLE